MASCPKCSYSLVFLEKRQRYKCAKCGRLFYPNFIDNREFREWNQRQRELNKEALRPKKRVKLTEEERKERIKASADSWRERNREQINARLRKAWAENPEKYRKNRTLQRKRNPEGFKIIDRIRYLRKEQKKLAIQRANQVQFGDSLS